MKKDKEWLKGRIKGFQEGENMFTAEFNAGVQDALEYVQELIDQLDDQETLSEEWIENHTASADTISYYSEESVPVVTVIKLKNLLVPKQDKPVIPQFVVDWIEKQMKFGYEDVFISMTRLRERAPEKVKFWFRNNSDTYARAWLDGYEVADEPHYYVAFEGEFNLLYVTHVDIYGENGKFNYNSESNKNHAIKFTDKIKAKYLADFLGAIVVEVTQ